jgi:hypothetical protein
MTNGTERHSNERHFRIALSKFADRRKGRSRRVAASACAQAADRDASHFGR